MLQNLLDVFIAWELTLYSQSSYLYFFVYSSLDFARDLHVDDGAARSARWIAWKICAKENDTQRERGQPLNVFELLQSP